MKPAAARNRIQNKIVAQLELSELLFFSEER